KIFIKFEFFGKILNFNIIHQESTQIHIYYKSMSFFCQFSDNYFLKHKRNDTRRDICHILNKVFITLDISFEFLKYLKSLDFFEKAFENMNC
ncbi:hypothetical protein BpHYR1_054257, partial [Brachionus plicatilis]